MTDPKIRTSQLWTVELVCDNKQCQRTETHEMEQRPEPWNLPGSWLWFLGPTRLYPGNGGEEILVCSDTCAVVVAGNEIAAIRKMEAGARRS